MDGVGPWRVFRLIVSYTISQYLMRNDFGFERFIRMSLFSNYTEIGRFIKLILYRTTN